MSRILSFSTRTSVISAALLLAATGCSLVMDVPELNQRGSSAGGPSSNAGNAGSLHYGGISGADPRHSGGTSAEYNGGSGGVAVTPSAGAGAQFGGSSGSLSTNVGGEATATGGATTSEPAATAGRADASWGGASINAGGTGGAGGAIGARAGASSTSSGGWSSTGSQTAGRSAMNGTTGGGGLNNGGNTATTRVTGGTSATNGGATTSGGVATGGVATGGVATGGVATGGTVSIGGTTATSTSPAIVCSNSDPSVLPIDQGGWVDKTCNNYGIQGSFYWFADLHTKATLTCGASACVLRKSPWQSGAPGPGLCINGSATGSPSDFGAGIGLGLSETSNDATSIKNPYNATANNVSGFDITLTGNTNGMKVRIGFGTSADGLTISPFILVDGPAGNSVTLSGSNQIQITKAVIPADWKSTDPSPPDPTAIYDLQIQVETDTAPAGTAFELCVTAIKPVAS